MPATAAEAPPAVFEDGEDLDLTDDSFFVAEADAPQPGPGDGPEPEAPADELPAEPDGDVDPEAPYGWTVDRVTGLRRPKKRLGRPGQPRDPITEADVAAAPEIQREPDEAPAKPKRGAVRASKPSKDTPQATTPTKAPEAGSVPAMPRQGQIAAGVNKLYRRAGKVLRGFDHDLGQALIECTRIDDDLPDDERELTVGEAWEQLARVNPRVRALVLRFIAGGTYGDLVMAHVPLGIALMQKPMVMKLIPFGKIMDSWLEPDEDTEDDDLTSEDIDAIRDLAEKTAGRLAGKMSPAAAQRLARQAAAAARDDGKPPTRDHLPSTNGRRQQPKRSTRSGRKAAAH